MQNSSVELLFLPFIYVPSQLFVGVAAQGVFGAQLLNAAMLLGPLVAAHFRNILPVLSIF
ncbi:hypothetical protein Acr_06g0006360 [Actinidia rufa]|uniref:Uncharacterized protein n=1 Tax=Actinidia rufa TaxID=165716 RepID=A0A7J0ER73_9ERIC|nr:hypothetical protein Acr_06g0006360 [Actinidia rufa]